MSEQLDAFRPAPSASTRGAGELELFLTVSEPALVTRLRDIKDPHERELFALKALMIGVTALDQAQSRIDAERVREEGERLIKGVGEALTQHQALMEQQIKAGLAEYFDPQSGKFSERVERLVKKDGDLEQVLRRQVGEGDSALVKTLEGQIGAASPLMKHLDPQSSDSLPGQLRQSVEAVLNDNREKILREFDLNTQESALNRFIVKLKEEHGEVSVALKDRIEEVASEFDLGKDDSALSRLVGKVETAQKKISDEFSLDKEDSALKRMKKELEEALAKAQQKEQEFHAQVMEKLTELTTRRDEVQKSTRHGAEFETALLDFLDHLHRGCDDMVTHVGDRTGLIRSSKKGDILIELGPEHKAAGARIVIEAKQEANYGFDKAREEIEGARKNRGAGIGLFVYSARVAPERLDGLHRAGQDIYVVWDAEDPSTDVNLRAALTLAKALSTRQALESEQSAIDLEAMDKAIREIQRNAEKLAQIRKSSETIKSSADTILKQSELMSTGLSKAVEQLDAGLADLKKG